MPVALPQIYEHLECETGKHCPTCTVDPAWRESAESAWGVKIICPLGKKLSGETPEPQPRPAKPAPSPRAQPLTPEQEETRRSRVEAAASAKPGPGSLLSRMIRAATGVDSAGCSGCDSRVKQMNAWGWWGCWKRRAVVASWLADECEKRNIHPDAALIWRAIRGAFRRKETP